MNKLKEQVLRLYDFVDVFYAVCDEENANRLEKVIDDIKDEIDKEPIERIKIWQKERLLDKQRFNYKNESANIVEELIEMSGFSVPKEYREKLMNEFAKFKVKFIEYNDLEILDGDNNEIAIDALFDICVFAIGAMMKLGYEPRCVFNEGIKHISSRTGSIVNGKFQKDLNVKTYEPQYDKCKIKD